MNLKEFGLTTKGVKYLIVVEFDESEQDGISVIEQLRKSHNITQLSSTLYGCDNPVDATLAVQGLKFSEGIRDVNLIRATDIMDLTRCLANQPKLETGE